MAQVKLALSLCLWSFADESVSESGWNRVVNDVKYSLTNDDNGQRLHSRSVRRHCGMAARVLRVW